MHLQRTALILLFLICFFRAQATHIVGGEITYECLSNDSYRITLTVYRDCYTGEPWFDNPAHVGVYDKNWNLVKNLSLPLNSFSNDTIPVELSNPCLTAPPDVCVHRTSYVTTTTLPFKPGGYSVVYQRCCRNKLIRNIPDPLNTGITIIAEIGEKALTTCNKGAKFNKWPPVAICVHEPIDFDHSATDPDGDSLVYRLCTPLMGPDSMNPIPNPPLKGPYDPVEWTDPPYNLSNVLGGVPLSIDPHTGFLTGVPNTIGNFVVGICVDEYRDGVLISTTRRDFQYNVAHCGKATASFFNPKSICDTLSWHFDNQSFNASTYLWYFNWPDGPTSTLAEPTYMFPDTGRYTIGLIAQPGQFCADTSIQEIWVTNRYVDASVTAPEFFCDAAGYVVSAQDLSVDPQYGISNWLWNLSGPQNSVSTQQNPDFVISKPGSYQLQLIVTSGNGCKDSTLLQFSANPPNFAALPNFLSMCAGDSIQLNVGGNLNLFYQWSPANTLNDPNAVSPIAKPLESTTYKTIITSQDSTCIWMDSVFVQIFQNSNLQVSADPGEIYNGQSSQLLAQLGMNMTGQYSWSPAASLSNSHIPNPIATPNFSTTYDVSVKLNSGCILTGTVSIEVLQRSCTDRFVFFPTAFSPNGDGENDQLRVESVFVEEIYWVIYNRWGEQIFQADSLDDEWDGTYKGQALAPDSYGYYLRAVCPGGNVLMKKGNVTLLR